MFTTQSSFKRIDTLFEQKSHVSLKVNSSFLMLSFKVVEAAVLICAIVGNWEEPSQCCSVLFFPWREYPKPIWLLLAKCLMLKLTTCYIDCLTEKRVFWVVFFFCSPNSFAVLYSVVTLPLKSCLLIFGSSVIIQSFCLMMKLSLGDFSPYTIWNILRYSEILLSFGLLDKFKW